MSDTDKIQRNGRINRRKFLAGVGAGTTAAVAGCGGGPTETPPGGQDETETPTDTPGRQSGGKPIFGMDTAPTTLNPLRATSAYSFQVIDRIYTYGTTVHPETYEFMPWAITDWELNPDNVGSSSPTITAELRDDLTFSDGQAVTAEDYKFTIEYIKEQQPAGSINASTFAAVEEVQVDSPDGTSISLFMSRGDNRWFTGILGTILLPQHIWSNVSDYSNYIPRENDGPIGSGAFVLDDFNWENWFELSTRPSEEVPIPSADYVDWIHDDAPFIDGLRVQIFGTKTAKDQALLEGDVDAVGVSGVEVQTAVEAQGNNNLEVHQNPGSGYNHFSFNIRRVPFDDKAFRQFLVMMVDGRWIVEDYYRNIGAIEGDYVVHPAFESWRLGRPDEIDEHEGIAVPDLAFPGTAGTFNAATGVEAARDFLVNHPEAKHDYSFGESQTDHSTAADGQELYVNGQNLVEAHTNNVGEGGEGPLIFSYQPPTEDLAQSRTGTRYISALKQVGIPVNGRVKTINAQLPTVYAQEDFDFYAMGWSLGVSQTHLSALYSSEQADLGYSDPDAEPTSAFLFNPMGYTNADELIFEDRETMDFEERRAIVKQIQARIWNDAPTAITEYKNQLEPVSTEFAGWIDTAGGVIGSGSWPLNLYQTQ